MENINEVYGATIFHNPDGTVEVSDGFETENGKFVVQMVDDNKNVHFYPIGACEAPVVKEHECCGKCDKHDADTIVINNKEHSIEDLILDNEYSIHPTVGLRRDSKIENLPPAVENFAESARVGNAILAEEMAEDMARLFKILYKNHVSTILEIQTQDMVDVYTNLATNINNVKVDTNEVFDKVSHNITDLNKRVSIVENNMQTLYHLVDNSKPHKSRR